MTPKQRARELIAFYYELAGLPPEEELDCVIIDMLTDLHLYADQWTDWSECLRLADMHYESEI